MNILTARVTPVKVGILEIEGLMTNEGDFGIGIPQVCNLLDVPQKNASREFKGLLGKDLTFLKVKIENSRVTMQFVGLTQFEILVAKLDRRGNKAAQDFRDDLVGMSLQQLFSDAFNVRFEQEERQRFLKTRQETKQVRHTATDAIKWYIDSKTGLSENYIKWIYVNCSEIVNLGLFGRKSKRVCIDLRISDRSKLRDHLASEELLWLSEIEHLAARLILYHDHEPKEAMKEAVARVAIPVVSRTA